jgi:glycerol uptake facilitator-like aquaporin
MRFTISRWMAATAVLGLNIGLARAYMLAEKRGEHLDEFDFGFLIFFALQFGLWRYLSTRGRRRRFWLGFEVSGLAATLALLTLLDSDIDLTNWYWNAASDLSYFCLPARVDVMWNEHFDWFLAIIYFLPELLAAALGGLLAMLLFKRPEGQ